jgi:NAD-dependent SIR2 family protein deacetylase
MSEIQRVTVRQLAHQIKGFSEEPTPRFAFFLGAGASVQSGIPTANSMIGDFKRRIIEAECPEQVKTEEAKEKWLTNSFPDEKNAYSILFEHYLPKEMARQQYIEMLVKKARLSFGYVVLSSLIASNYVKTLVTTNFDDLIYLACTTYTGIRPVVYSYGLLAADLRFTSENPKILKLHGDYLYSSLKNTRAELKTQDPNMKQQVSQTLNEYGLIVIGYSGGDQSVMEILRWTPLSRHQNGQN